MESDNIADDILKGAEEIADWLGIDRRAVYYAVAKNRIPNFRIGSNVFARKSTLRKWIAEQEASSQGDK